MTEQVRWDHPSLCPPREAERISRGRRHLSWYREVCLGARYAPKSSRRDGGPVGSLLHPEDVRRRPGLNFLTPAVVRHVAERRVAVRAERGTLEPTRLQRNMLSSMPLCFNLFGSLLDANAAGEFLREVFALPARNVELIECEWAPPPDEHLGDRTAFDAFVAYTDERGRRCFLGVETKYTDSFSAQRYDKSRYQEVTARSGIFREGAAARLVGRRTNQLWRMAMLAASMLSTGQWYTGEIAVLALGDDRSARSAVKAVSDDVVKDGFVRFVALEDLIATAKAYPSLEPWARAFEWRYLDLSPVSRA
jgi:hypothetical protein